MITGRCSKRSFVSVIAFALIVSCPGVTGSGQQTDEEREKSLRVADILVALGAQDGRKIADVGAADGFIAIRIARAVAPAGRAYAVDIDGKALDQLRERAARDAVTNIEIILGEPADPKLPAGEIDAVLIRNTYHEMPEYKSVLAGIKKALTSGGTLIIIEAITDILRKQSRDAQIKEHRIAPDLVDAELREAGFEILERQDPFTAGGFWLIRARRP